MSEPVKAPPGHIIDDQGNVRKVLGTLPVTRDGCVVDYETTVYAIDHGEIIELHAVPYGLVCQQSFGGDGAEMDDALEECGFPASDDVLEWVGSYSYYEEDTGASEWFLAPLSECYSTRAAAEAARAAEVNP